MVSDKKLNSETFAIVTKILDDQRSSAAEAAAAIPPPKVEPIPASHTESLALLTIVMALTAAMAEQNQKLTGHPPQHFINDIAVRSQKALNRAELSATDGRDLEEFRAKALEHVNRVLGGVRFPVKKTRSN